MLTRSFNRAYRHLVMSFGHHQDARRSPDTVAELGRARWTLEVARRAMASEREQLIATDSAHVGPVKHVAMSDEQLARLRVLGSGLGH